MVFNSYIFIFLFLPITLIGYYLINLTHKYAISKIWLIGMSLWFYGYFKIEYLWIISLSIIGNYLFYLAITSDKHRNYSKAFMITGVILNVLVLFIFKYFNFTIRNINSLFGTDFFVTNILLPLGISFFTFQQIGFLVDAYKGEASNYKLVDYALFISFFPQLIAGPIVSHNDLVPQLMDETKKSFNSENFFRGCVAFVLGLSKKVLIADVFAKAADWGFASIDYGLNSMSALVSLLAFTVQLYFDFSGYSDMAYGLGLMMNVEIPMNFDSPYRAINIVDFWGRWHITLSAFFTKYVYIPLGGSRRGRKRKYLNYMIIFLISGIWHGAEWTYFAWGVMNGVAIVLVKMLIDFCNDRNISIKSEVAKRLLTPLAVFANMCFFAFTLACFRAENIRQFRKFVGILFTFTGNWYEVYTDIGDCFTSSLQFYVLKFLHLSDVRPGSFIFCILYFLIAFVILYFGKTVRNIANTIKPTAASAVAFGVLSLVCIISISGVSTFIYYNF